MPAVSDIQKNVVKYLNIAQNLPSFIAENNRLLSQNSFYLDLLRNGSNTPGETGFLNNQFAIYSDAQKKLKEINQKHTVAKEIIARYPDMRESILSSELNLSMIDVSLMATVAILSGSILTLYDEISNKINTQNYVLSQMTQYKQDLNNGVITPAQYSAIIQTLSSQQVNPKAVNFPNIILIGGLLFGGFYVITNYEKVEKTVRKWLT